MIKQLESWISQSAREWNVSRQVARAIFYVPLVGTIVIALTRLNKGFFRLLLGEDGPIEWLQFAMFAITALAAAGVAIRLRRASDHRNALLFTIAAVALVLIAGEEISWGQRIIGFDTPEPLAAINKQNELTIHNIGETLTVINFFMMLVGAWGMVAWLIDRRFQLGRLVGGLRRLVVVPFFLAGPFSVIFAYKLFRFTLWPQSGFTITKYGEWGELCLAFGLCAFTLLVFRRVGSPRPATKTVAKRPRATSLTERRI